MKLQPKKQVNILYQEERRKEIDEGVNLAKKIDVLRETLGSLEKQHETFLAATSRELEERTREKRLEIKNLTQEISKLTEQRQILVKPLDDEWSKLEEAKQIFDQDKQDLESRENELQKKEEGIKETEKRLEERERTIASKEETIESVSQETIRLNDEARQIHTKNSKEYDDFVEERTARLAEIEAKEKANANQEVYNKHQKDILDKREKDLKDKEKGINFKYEQLLRTAKKIK
jgi:chromosome segregation protein